MCDDKELEDATQKLKLAEYEIRERIEERVWQRVTRIGWAVGLALTLLGFVGFGAVKKQIGDTVSTDIRNELREDSKVLRETLADELAEMRVLSKEVKRQSESAAVSVTKLATDVEKARRQLVEMDQNTEQLSALKKKFAELAKETDTLSKGLEQAVLISNSASLAASKASDFVFATVTGDPAVFTVEKLKFGETTFNLGIAYPVRVSGVNFGGKPGEVRLHVGVTPLGQMAGDISPESIALNATEISEWSDTEIKLSLNPSTLQELAELKKQRQGLGLFSPKVVVQTATGKIAVESTTNDLLGDRKIKFYAPWPPSTKE